MDELYQFAQQYRSMLKFCHFTSGIGIFFFQWKRLRASGSNFQKCFIIQPITESWHTANHEMQFLCNLSLNLLFDIWEDKPAIYNFEIISVRNPEKSIPSVTMQYACNSRPCLNLLRQSGMNRTWPLFSPMCLFCSFFEVKP